MHLKTDSFVVLSNVHFPTDYNLLWDSARKSLDIVNKFIKKHSINGWRKSKNWYREIKKLSREVGQSSKKSEENKKIIVEKYLQTAKLLSDKLHTTRTNLPLCDLKDTS